MIVYAKNITPRVSYIISTLLPALGIVDFVITEDPVSFINADDFKINYSDQRISSIEFWIKPVNLLFENDIKQMPIHCFEVNKIKSFFGASGSDFPFDIFAASFYLISRYEEYLPHKPDMYGRFAHEDSIAHKEGFLKEPLVNIWIQQLALKMINTFPTLQLTPPPFRFLPTYDIDMAWSYKNKGWVRNTGGLLRSVFHGEWSLAGERINVLFGNQKDPFQSYHWLDELHEDYQLKPLYFFLLAQQNKDYDKNILPSKKALQKLVKQHNAQYAMGIHPSWQSGDEEKLLVEEIEKLEKIINKKVNKSRQHYIRMTLPETYRILIKAGITEDYSMGYGSTNGFRASFCLPFKWYDLEKEQTTSLTVYPFCFMDANSYYEQTKTVQEALDELTHYFNKTKDVNGLLITIWHNQFFGTDAVFIGWKEVYKAFIEEVSKA